nr:MAG TPA: hypothetical protein [Caudoviricetes sp.]
MRKSVSRSLPYSLYINIIKEGRPSGLPAILTDGSVV